MYIYFFFFILITPSLFSEEKSFYGLDGTTSLENTSRPSYTSRTHSNLDRHFVDTLDLQKEASLPDIEEEKQETEEPPLNTASQIPENSSRAPFSIFSRPVSSDESSYFLPDYSLPLENNSPQEMRPPPLLNFPTVSPVMPLERLPQEAHTDPSVESEKTILINFNNVSIIEFIRFISKVSGRNFIFDENDLQFNVTIVSEEPTPIESVITALLQELRIRGLYLIEDGENFIIHTNPSVRGISKVVSEINKNNINLSEIITRVFDLNAIDPAKAASIIKPLLSDAAILDVLEDSHHLILTDLSTNVAQVAKLLSSVDAPNSGFTIGQYAVHNGDTYTLTDLVQQIMLPIAGEQTISFIPYDSSKTVYVVSTPFLVQKALAILSKLDFSEGKTGIFDLDHLDLNKETGNKKGKPLQPGDILKEPTGQWALDDLGNWFFRPLNDIPSQAPPRGRWVVDDNGRWQFVWDEGAPLGNDDASLNEGGPKGMWIQDPNGHWIYRLADGAYFKPQSFNSGSYDESGELPIGEVQKTKFYIYKLRYRKGDQIQDALNNIGSSLGINPDISQDLLASINSVQWLQATNSLVLTGSKDVLDKMIELVEQIDTPLRQVFIEMLILDTSITDSLEFGVNYSTNFGGGKDNGAQAFLTAASPLNAAVAGAGLTTYVPDPSLLNKSLGFSLGIIGRSLSHNGTEYGTISALVRALHDDVRTNIIMNPKILTEDNSTAEIFVGINTQFKTQSVSNDRGSVITNNYEYRDIGTRLKVTPLISNNDVIYLQIEEEISNTVTTPDSSSSGSNANTSADIGPTTSLNKTTTRVHVPNNYFLVLSGMIHDEEERSRSQVPCLGGVPIIGAAFSYKKNQDTKRNLMIFIRPQIIDTEEEIQSITKHQQDIILQKSKQKRLWQYETEEALDLFNLKKDDPYDTRWDE